MKTFEELGLNEVLLRAIKELGFENPMPVQEEVIPYLLEGNKDVIALAQTGTGKTAAFGLPLLQKLDIDSKKTQVLIMCPTRELCLQIADDLNDYGKYMTGLHILPVYGGSSIKNQIDNLKKGVQIIVATPGRLLDLMRRGHVDLEGVRNIVMDEADEMLDMGFSEDIDAILDAVPEDRNTLLFSATMPDEIEKITKKFMNDPREIVIGNKNESTASVRHIYYMVKAQDKYQTLKRIIDFCPKIYGIIFCRTKADTQEISDKLIHDGYNVDALHGDLSQQQRDYVMQRFRLHNIQLLVATDVAARGIDVEDLTHIINYTLPDDNEVYTHRSGRTGRAGKTGISIAIINLRERKRIQQIEKEINKVFEVGKIPTGKEICSKQIFSLVDRLEKVDVDEDEIAEILPAVNRKLEWLDKEDLVKRIVSMEFNRILAYYKENEDFEVLADRQKKERKEGAKSDGITPEQGYTKLFLNLGKMDGIGPKNILGMINDSVGGSVAVGRIDLFSRHTLFDVDSEMAQQVMDEIGAMKVHNRKIKISVATPEQAALSLKSKEEKKSRRSEGGEGRGERRGEGRGDRRSREYGDRRSEGRRSDHDDRRRRDDRSSRDDRRGRSDRGERRGGKGGRREDDGFRNDGHWFDQFVVDDWKQGAEKGSKSSRKKK